MAVSFINLSCVDHCSARAVSNVNVQCPKVPASFLEQKFYYLTCTKLYKSDDFNQEGKVWLVKDAADYSEEKTVNI